MNQLKMGALGFIVGGILGFFIGLGEMNWIKKSQRSTMFPIVMGVTVAFFSIGGAIKAINWEEQFQEEERNKELERIAIEKQKELHRIENEKVLIIEKKLGIRPIPQSEYFKEGRYWVGVTKWLDPRSNREYIIKTEKSKCGEIKSSLNGTYIISHIEKSANKDFIPAAHKVSKDRVFKKIIGIYKENSLKTIEDIFEL